MSLSNLESENTIRLLDIIYGLYGDYKKYPNQKLPFLAGDDGSVLLDPDLITELNKDGNRDLLDWAHENIVSLFE